MTDAIEVSFDSMLHSIEVVGLEVIPNELYHCERIVTADSFIYALMNRKFGHELFIYNDKGTFIKKLAYLNKPLCMSYIKLNQAKTELMALVNYKYLYKYTLNGELISKEQLPVEMEDIMDYGGKGYLVFDGHFNQKSDNSVFRIENNEIKDDFIWKERKKWFQVRGRNVFVSSTALDDIYILPPKKDTIFKFDKDKKEMAPYKHLDFDGLFLSADKYPENGFSFKAYADVLKSNKYVTGFNHFHLLRDKLFFRSYGKINSHYYISLADEKLYRYNPTREYVKSLYFVGSDEEYYQYYMIRQKYLPDFEKGVGRSVQKINVTSDEEGNSMLLIKLKLS